VRQVQGHGHRDEAQVVHITGQPGYTTAIERAKGFEDRLPEVCPDVTVVDTQPGDWNREKSQQVMEAFLVKYDDIDGVYAGDDNMGVGALNAAKAAGREGIIFVGATNFAVGYEAMERGEYWGSIYQSPVDDAEAALQTAIDVLDGKEVPFLNYFDTPKITQDNRASSPSRSSDRRSLHTACGSARMPFPCCLALGGCDGTVDWTGMHRHGWRAGDWPRHRGRAS
jgi:ABC-type sugar transport system substrate-binding protein